jgi:acetamidase/formamidase
MELQKSGAKMSNRVCKAGNIKYALSGDDKFVASIEPGETIVVECAINVNDGTIRHIGQQLIEADVTLPFVNGATGPIEVRGSNVGDMLKVEILKMELDSLGFTALWPGIGMFPDWVRRKEFGRQTRVVEVKGDLVHWNEHVKLPIKPMIGVIGVAPVHGAVLTIDNGPHGGNLDVQEITTGNTVLLRVNKAGAHLFLGDCHAIQGDGECNGMGAIDRCDADGEGLPGESATPLEPPAYQTPAHICTLGCARPQRRHAHCF